MQITYLLNSGFTVFLEDRETLLVFDDFRDPANIVDDLIEKAKCVYFFISHSHFDHFDTHIIAYAPRVKAYIASEEIQGTRGGGQMPAEKTVFMKNYDVYRDGCIAVDSYDSTDAGTSFCVTVGDTRIFHAGDFNWWHWKGDTEENNKFARNGFMKQMKRLDGLEADIAFFPVDSRLEEFAALGAKEFCARTNVKALVTMHNATGPSVVLPEDFFAVGREIPVWEPREAGERRYLDKGGLHT
ncbi:MBL fold metallo-hydrolase [Selenomonas sp. TAMA-11512]|uniref:MBL fold metallo-hydrolase n=1 Tax=Selenomonas sp. TAMA-11512 TaxID=3095337 RepID=UPI0030879DCE|nr:MBL fold metallo-hydrolase [Selenomonas sp. TAMA-11512]